MLSILDTPLSVGQNPLSSYHLNNNKDERENDPAIQGLCLQAQLKTQQMIDEWDSYIGSESCLPPLEYAEGDLDLTIFMLNQMRTFIGNNGFEAEFSIADFLNCIFSKYEKYIDSIKLVGGAVNSALSHSFLCKALRVLKVENPHHFLTEEYLKKYFCQSNDIDFRIHLKEEANQCFMRETNSNFDIEEDIRRSICKFIAQKSTSKEMPSLDECRFIWEYAVAKKRRNAREGISIYGLRTTQTFIEFVFFTGKNQREFLFSIDDLRIPLDDILSNRARTIYLQSTRNGWHALLDKMFGSLDIIETETTNIFGFPSWITKQVKGYVSPSTYTHHQLLGRYVSLLKVEDLPNGYTPSKKLQGNLANIPPLVEFHHFLCLENHLKKTPEEAFALGLLLCTHLESHFEKEVLVEIWQLISANIKKIYSEAIIPDLETENFFPIKYIYSLSRQRLSFTQLFTWMSFVTCLHAISTYKAIVKWGKVSKVKHTRMMCLQATFNLASISFPIVGIPSIEIILLAREYLTQSPFLIDWNQSIIIDFNYREQLQTLIDILENLSEMEIDPYLSYEINVLIQISALADRREQLLDLFPIILAKDTNIACSSIAQAFKSDDSLKAFQEIKSSIEQNPIVCKQPTLVHQLCLEVFVCCHEPYLRGNASKHILNMNPKTIETQTFYKSIYSNVATRNSHLALKLLSKIQSTQFEKCRNYNSLFELYNPSNPLDYEAFIENLCEFLSNFKTNDNKSLVERIKALNLLFKAGIDLSNGPLNLKIITVLHNHLKLMRISSRKHAKVQSSNPFPLLGDFLKKFQAKGQFDAIKPLMLLLKENDFYELESLWLKQCESILAENCDKAYLLLKEGQKAGILKNEMMTDFLISILDHMSNQLVHISNQRVIEIISDILKFSLTKGNGDKLQKFLQKIALTHSQEEILQLLNRAKGTPSQNLQELRFSFLKRLLKEIPFNFPAIEAIILDLLNDEIASGTYALTQEIDTYISHVNSIAAIQFLLLPKTIIYFKNDSETFFNYLINKLELLTALDKHTPIPIFEAVLKHVCTPELTLPFSLSQKTIFIIFNHLNTIWDLKINLPISFRHLITSHHPKLIQILEKKSYIFINFLNIYNISITTTDNTINKTIIGSFEELLESDLHFCHLLLKNSIDSKRLSIKDSNFNLLINRLIRNLIESNKDDFVFYWTDKFIQTIEIEVIIDIIKYCIHKNTISNSLKYLKHIKRITGEGIRNYLFLFEDCLTALVRQEDTSEETVDLMIKNCSLFNGTVDAPTVENYVTEFLVKDSISSNKKIELLFNFRISDGCQLEMIVSNLIVVKRLLEDSFKLFLKYLNHIPIDKIASSHLKSCIIYLNKLEEAKSIYGNKFFIESDLFLKIFSDKFVIEYENYYELAFEYYYRNFSSNSIKSSYDSLIQIKKYYENSLPYPPNTHLFYISINKSIVFALLKKSTPESTLQACKIVAILLSTQDDRCINQEQWALIDLIGSHFLEIAQKSEEKLLQNSSEDFYNDEIQTELKHILNWWLNPKNTNLVNFIPFQFLQAIKDHFSAELIIMALQLTLTCRKSYQLSFECSNDILFQKINNLCFDTFLRGVQSKHEDVRLFAYGQIKPALQSIIRQKSDSCFEFLFEKQLRELTTTYLIFELKNPYSKDVEYKLNLYHANFKYTSKIQFNFNTHGKDPSMQSKIVKKAANLLLLKLLEDFDEESFYGRFDGIIRTLSKKIRIDHDSLHINNSHKEQLELRYNLIGQILQLSTTSAHKELWYRMLLKNIQKSYEAFRLGEFPEDRLLFWIDIVSLHPKFLDIGIVSYNRFLDKILFLLQSIPTPSQNMQESIFQYRLMRTTYDYNCFDYGLSPTELIILKSKLVISSVARLLSTRHPVAIYKGLKIVLNTFNTYTHLNPKEFKTWIELGINYGTECLSSMSDEELKKKLKAILSLCLQKHKTN